MVADKEVIKKIRKRANEDLKKQFESMHARGTSMKGFKKGKDSGDNRYGRKRFGTR